MNAMPPPRYRIVEKGRRLITVDSQTGEALGMSATLGADPLFGSPPVRLDARPGVSSQSATVSATTGAALPAIAVRKPGKPSALDAAKPRASASSDDKSAGGRWALIAILGMAILTFLIATGLWIFVVALFIIPLTRGFLMQAVRAGWPKVSAWAKTGSSS